MNDEYIVLLASGAAWEMLWSQKKKNSIENPNILSVSKIHHSSFIIHHSSVTHPSAAVLTDLRYLYKTPLVAAGGGVCQAARRRWISCSSI